MRSNLPCLRRLLGMMLLGASVSSAQTPPTLENDVRNILSQQPSTAWPPPPPSIVTDPRTPTANQFRAGTVIGGWQTTRIFNRGGMVENGGFELPAVSAFQYSPTASSAAWTFENQAGVATKGDWFSVETPEGRQGAFFQNANSSARQGVLLNSGAYKVVFKAISRHVTPANPLQVYLTASSASTPVLVASVAQSALSSSEWRSFESSQVTVASAGSYTLRIVVWE